MLLIFALLLAIPSYGLTIILYIAWEVFKKHSSKTNSNRLSDIEKAIFHVAERGGGSATCFSELSYSDVVNHLVMNDLPMKIVRSWGYESHLEFDMEISAQKYDVHISKEPQGNGNGAIIRARRSEPWLDKLYAWMEDSFGDPTLGKYHLPAQCSITFGSAIHPENRPGKPIAVPQSLGKLVSLERLALINQDIASLPKSIGSLTNLKELKLGGNAIERLPAEICNLSELEIFTIWMNDLKELPSEFGMLSKLKGLDLSYNDLTRLPDSIINLANLERLYMTGNRELKLTTLQKNWIVGLMERDAVVQIDDERYAQLKEEFPYLPAQRERVD